MKTPVLLQRLRRSPRKLLTLLVPLALFIAGWWFGLPPAEALALGTATIINDLPVYREFLGDLPVYLDGNDSYLWAKTIHEMATTGGVGPRVELENLQLPTWDAHFNKVLGVT